MSSSPHRNPFRYGGLALDAAFMDRERELQALKTDLLNGQDVVMFAPRRYGKSSLIWRVAQELVAADILVAQVDLMTTPTKPRLAEKLAKTIHDDIASRVHRAKDRLRVFQGLRITPTVTVDPEDGSLSFSFRAGWRSQDIDDTLEQLLRLPAQLAADRKRQAVLVLDEFQEVVDIDPALPRLMRAVFQEQTDVAHVYLGSKRHMMERIFSDANEPFWRSAKQMELGVIPPDLFRAEISQRFDATGKAIEPAALEAALDITGGHPYATQQLAYFVWEATDPADTAKVQAVEDSVARVVSSEDAHFTLAWQRASSVQRQVLQALAEEPGHPLGSEYRDRHGLPTASSVQKAVEALERQELVARDGPAARLAEPFLPEWIRRMRD